MKIYLPTLPDNNDYVYIDNSMYYVIHQNSANGDLYNVSVYDPRLAYTEQKLVSNYDDSFFSSHVALDHDQFTTNIYYRLDLPDILISFGVIFAVICFGIVFICKSFFRGLFK